VTISFCSLQPAWEAHYAAPALTPPKGRDEGGGCGVGRKGNAEAGFDLFALDQPTEPESGVLGKAKVSREFVTWSELSVKSRREEAADARLPAACNC